MRKRAVVIKIGGTVAEDRGIIGELLRELASIEHAGVIVHGGGKAVTRLSERLGLSPQFHDGVRLTSPEEMEIVDMVLAGRVNTEFVRGATRLGIPAVGLTGADEALLTGALVGDPRNNRTATVVRVERSLIEDLVERDILPIVATVGIGDDGEAVNINADEAARAIAVAVAQDREVILCYISDIPGVLTKEATVIPKISVNLVERYIADGTISGGMTAKIRSSAAAVTEGLHRVAIGGYRTPGDLTALIHGEMGTTIE